MLRTVLALSLLAGAFTLASTPQAMATCWSNSTCGGKKISKNSCRSCLRGKDGGKSWSQADGTCTKSCSSPKKQSSSR